MSHKLDILIPTLNEPHYIRLLNRLLSTLNSQISKYPNEIQVKIHDAGRFMSTGQKRNELIASTVGEYFVQIDSDDKVSHYYIDELMNGIAYSPDVITFNGFMTTDGHSRKEFTIKLGERYEERNGRYYRYPNHLCCFKRSVVESVKFRNVWQMEDYYWATDIRERRLLKSEHHIEKWMYEYCFVTNKTKSHASTRVR
jgi:glycosyltransferase involved in cell wall biosynthesis